MKDELVEIAVDRLAQIIQVAKTTECLSGRKCKCKCRSWGYPVHCDSLAKYCLIILSEGCGGGMISETQTICVINNTLGQ